VKDYNLDMNIVNVAVLKEKLSYYLKLVKSGEEVVVTSHRHRVARIVPVTASSAEIVEPTRPVKDLKTIRGIVSRRSLSGVKSLLDDRRRR
jgi:prevent-host-death family protein